MANLNQLIDIDKIKKEYNLENFIETGTGLGETLQIILDYGFKTIQSCEIEKSQHEKLISKFQQENVKIHLGKSSDSLPLMLSNIDGPALIFLDAHFPGQGYVRNDFIPNDYSLDDIIPLKQELQILKSFAHIKKSVIVIDDLRIYKKGNYLKGDWEDGRKLFNNPECGFLETFELTHEKIESEIEQGCVYFFPKKPSILISHKNTGTIGDFATSFPILSSLSKLYGPLNFTLPEIYSRLYNGFKEFMEYQEFVGKIDFEDREGDLDLQCHPIPTEYEKFPIQTYYVKKIIKDKLGLELDVDENFRLKVPFLEIEDSIKDKNIIVDRVKTQVIKRSGLFDNENENYWIKPTIGNFQIGDSLIHNINICIQTRKKIFATATGLPILLQHFDKEMDLIAFDTDGELAWKYAYFHNKKHIKFFLLKDFKKL